jgi:hypothetical protein
MGSFTLTQTTGIQIGMHATSKKIIRALPRAVRVRNDGTTDPSTRLMRKTIAIPISTLPVNAVTNAIRFSKTFFIQDAHKPLRTCKPPSCSFPDLSRRLLLDERFDLPWKRCSIIFPSKGFAR